MYLGTNSKYKFYSAEIDRCPETKLLRIARACEKVEADVWNACENFYQYIKKQSAILYAKEGDEFVGFALFDLYVKDNTLVVAANECMVLKNRQGDGLPTIFMAILIAHIRKDNALRDYERQYKAINFLSVTVNFKLMEAFRRYNFIAKRSSFHPDRDIISVARDYIAKEKLTPLNPEKIFFIRGAFPNAVKTKTLMSMPDYVPKDFEAARGDAFLYVCRISRFWLLGLVSKLVRKKYQFKFSKRLIPISRISREHVIYAR